MLQLIISKAVEFLEANMGMVGMLISIVEFLKVALAGQPWFRGEYITVIGFALAFLFVIPAGGFAGIDWLQFVANAIVIGGVATGLFKAAASIAAKARGNKVEFPKEK